MKRLAALLTLAPLPALAHHPMGGAVPATLSTTTRSLPVLVAA